MSDGIKVSTVTEGDAGIRLEYGKGHVIDATKTSDGFLAVDIYGPNQGMITYLCPEAASALKAWLNANF